MKKILAIAIFTVLMVTRAACAVNMQPDVASMAKSQTDLMTTELKLTPDQVTKVNAINVKYMEKMMAQFQGGPGGGAPPQGGGAPPQGGGAPPQGGQGGGNMGAMSQQQAALNAEKRKELQAVLTAEQLKKYDDYMAANPRGFMGGGPGGPGGARPQQ